MQRLPKELFSVHGAVPLVRTDDGLDATDFAEFLFKERRVHMSPSIAKEMEWPTYWHEAIHVALYDAGTPHQLTDKKEEAICDAVATYLAAMMRAGMLRVVTPRNP